MRNTIILVAILIGGCSSKPAPARAPSNAVDKAPSEAQLAAAKPSSIQFAMPGEISGMPSLAASSNRVALVWTGTRNGAMNVYSAVSEDGGVTFPVQTRVNDRDGDVAANVEQPPRVAVTAADVAVIWLSKTPGANAFTVIRRAASSLARIRVK